MLLHLQSLVLQVLHDLHARYENALVEIAASLQLSRNIIVALLSLQSWKPFLQRWLRACIPLLDVKASSSLMDTTSKAADDILKVWYLFCFCITVVLCYPNVQMEVLYVIIPVVKTVMQCMMQKAEKSIPRSAENIGLAVGALCLVSTTMLCSELKMPLSFPFLEM